MCIITKTRLGLKKTYNLDPRDIKLTGRSCKGISIYNLLRIPKSEEIIEIHEWTNKVLIIYYKYNK